MEYSWVYTKRFEQFKILALQSHKENYDAFIKFALDPEDLTWWKENILHRSKDISDKPIILKVLKKIINDKAEGIIVVSDWPAQPWWPMFQSLICSKILKFKPNVNLLRSSSREPHPLWRSLTLVVAKLPAKH
ncbi:hypothetical protein TKK_0009763 [Trichogramma kaykai]